MQSTKSTTQYSQLNFEDNSTNNYENREISIVLKRSPSLKWKIFHGIHIMLGGLFLIAGSSMHFAKIIRRYSMALTAGGCFFTIGSFFLLLADLQEWWYHRYICCSHQISKDIYEVSLDNQCQNSHTFVINRLERINNELNILMSACGSFCYVIGSMLLIPVFEKYATVGYWLIIAGSILIFLCALWKIYRTGRINMIDISALFINVFVGFGGVFYFFGIAYIVFGFSMNDFGMNLSASFCVMGGTSIFLASIFLQFRYYSKK